MESEFLLKSPWENNSDNPFILFLKKHKCKEWRFLNAYLKLLRNTA